MIQLSLPQNIIAAIGQTDLIIVGSAILLLFVISYVFGREEKDINDFFLGSRKIPSIIACLSFVATEVSALTIIGVPAIAFSENWEYLQFFIGSAAARIVVAFLFIPVFYKYNCTSIYEFLRHRFGPETQYAGSIFFFITRLISSSVRLYAACMGVGIIMGWGLAQTILAFTLVGIIFIAFGGIKAVVWAGAYQAIVFFAAGVALLTYLSLHINGGLSAAWQTASEAGRLSIFNFEFDLNNPTTFWAGSINAFFIGLAVFGTDQEMMQRLLTVRTRKTSQKTIFMTILAAFPILCIYLGIGTLLYVFYQQNPGIIQPGKAKEVISHFVSNSLPAGLKGLMLSAIILASIDSPLSALASSFVTDIYRPLIKKAGTEKHYLIISRIGVAAFGIILGSIAFACDSVENILWFAFEIFSLTGGATLGVFIFGVLTKRKTNFGNVIAMIASTSSMTILLLLSHKGYIKLAWSWLIVVGTIMTFTLSYLFSCIPAGQIKNKS
ncbi:MAG: sodium/solute symporter [Phycisphaerae bacterium]|nr:sodium/solute symporter [Phycisphaerae bacterium]